MKSYSQLGQDKWVLETLNYKRNGFFLDSGCADGYELSNTFLLEQFFDWTGLLVEPDANFFARAAAIRKSPIENVCLYEYDGEIKFTESGWASAIDESGAFTKQCRTIKSLLEKYNAPKTIDYWSLDTEGSELEILKTFPWGEYKFNLISIEHNCNREESDLPGLSQRIERRAEVHQILSDWGFVHIKDVICDDFFAHKDVL
jgi:hypothetical protein